MGTGDFDGNSLGQETRWAGVVSVVRKWMLPGTRFTKAFRLDLPIDPVMFHYETFHRRFGTVVPKIRADSIKRSVNRFAVSNLLIVVDSDRHIVGYARSLVESLSNPLYAYPLSVHGYKLVQVLGHDF